MSQHESTHAISKILSANDTGDTGGHQAGILVPKRTEILSFFPLLDPSVKNPRHHLVFHDKAEGRWQFAFIYYNNALFGGTRDEYRLTRMTGFIRRHNLKPGDELILVRQGRGGRSISYRRQRTLARSESGALKLGSSWKVIEI